MDRYRIVGLVGRGGMGEVYRADDLKLGQSVALKFLPEAVDKDPGRLARFLNEVRIARQISHGNICRVYDVGEVDGHHFLSMEFVDGEDLSSLLRRIGRLPRDKAIQIARQMCAGLAAAHEQGILHRDLKPANVMIDGRGRTRITDFGLAGLADGFGGAELRAGTPAYMAPEQLAGREVSVRSDLYSLALVLYEIFTGRQAFQASTRAELERLQKESAPTSPSSFVEGFDPAVERVIFRCLEHDPAQRPASALSVAAALPGGDPLAAALAAGETPSPEMVADAAVEGILHPGLAAACLAFILLGLTGSVLLSGQRHLIRCVPLDKPPEALVVEAREIIRDLGHTDGFLDSARGFSSDLDYLQQVVRDDPSAARWKKLGTIEPAPIVFWYRQSPQYLVPANFVGRVTEWDPPPTISGMVQVGLDPKGRLRSFLAVPPQLDESRKEISDPDWSLAFRKAGLDAALFHPVEPKWNPLIDCDRRAAWEGAYSDQPDVAIRVEACSYSGSIASFDLITPWSRPGRMQPYEDSVGARVAGAVVMALLVVVVITGILLARRNLRMGRGDRRGAFRLALYLFATLELGALLSVSHVPDFSEMSLLAWSLQENLFTAALVWLVYIALEPYVRRLWPDVLVSWSRLLAGRLRDPVIGRDILVGGSAAIIMMLVLGLESIIAGWLGLPPLMPEQQWYSLAALASLRMAMASALSAQGNAFLFPMATLFLILLLRVILRRQWAAVGVILILAASLRTLFQLNLTVGSAAPVWLPALVLFLGGAVIWSLILFVMIRFGILATVWLWWVLTFLGNYPLTFDFTAWYAGRFFFILLALAALSVYGFWISRAGRPLEWEELLPQ